MTREELKQELGTILNKGGDAKFTLTEAIMSKVDIGYLDLSNHDLSNWDTRDIPFMPSSRCFEGVNFSRCNMTRMKTSNAIFTRAIFNDANISGMDFSGTATLTEEQLQKAWAKNEEPPINLPDGIHFKNAVYGPNGKYGNVPKFRTVSETETILEISKDNSTKSSTTEEKDTLFEFEKTWPEDKEPETSARARGEAGEVTVKTQEFRKEPITEKTYNPYALRDTDAFGIETGPNGASYLYPASPSEEFSETEINKIKAQIQNCYFSMIRSEQAIKQIAVSINPILRVPLPNDIDYIEEVVKLRIEVESLKEKLRACLEDNKNLAEDIEVLRQIETTNSIYKRCRDEYLLSLSRKAGAATGTAIIGLMITGTALLLSNLGEIDLFGLIGDNIEITNKDSGVDI